MECFHGTLSNVWRRAGFRLYVNDVCECHGRVKRGGAGCGSWDGGAAASHSAAFAQHAKEKAGPVSAEPGGGHFPAAHTFAFVGAKPRYLIWQVQLCRLRVEKVLHKCSNYCLFEFKILIDSLHSEDCHFYS